MDKLTTRVDLDRLCKLFKLPTQEELDEGNTDYVDEAGSVAIKEAVKDADTFGEAELTDEERDEIRSKAETEASDELYHRWHGAVMSAIESVFAEHGLQLEPCKARRPHRKGFVVKYPHEFNVVPVESWSDAANKIRDTITGYGLFEFWTLREFLESGPYTPRQAVLSHLNWMRRRSEVYGTSSPQRVYEMSFR